MSQKNILSTWFWSIMLYITWYLGNMGLYLLIDKYRLGAGSFSILIVVVLWLLVLAGVLPRALIKTSTTESMQKKMVIFTLGLALLFSLLLIVSVVLTPVSAQSNSFFWEQIIAYGGAMLTIIILVVNFLKQS